MNYNISKNETHILLLLDPDYDHINIFNFKSMAIPLSLTITYIILLLWSVRKDRKEKFSTAAIDIRSASMIQPHPEQPQPKPYNRWDPNRTQENWTNVTAMNVTTPNAGITDRIEDPSLSIMMAKTGHAGNISRIPSSRRSNSIDSQIKASLELANQPTNKSSSKQSLNNPEVPHQQLVEFENTEGDSDQHADPHIMRSKRRRNSQTRVEKPLKKETFRGKFLKLATDRNSVLSFYFKTSKIFPRYKRLTLIFLLIELNLFMTSVIFLSGKSPHRLRASSYFMYLGIDWLLFIILLILTRVSKERLKNAEGFEEFLQILAEVRKEGVVKMVILAILFTVFTMVCFSQLILFACMFGHLYIQLIIAGAVMSVIHLGIIDLLWCAVLALIYVRGYDSESSRAIYRCLSITAWKI